MLKPILALLLAASPAFFVKPVAQEEDLSTVKMTRARALKGLRGCPRKHRDCNDWSADFLIDLYWHGDRGVLDALLDAQPYGDGAMASGLGNFYAELLQKQPHVFLREISGRPAKKRFGICMAAGSTDGSGMSGSMRRDVRASLRRVARERGTRLARIARDCWDVASEADSHARSQVPERLKR